MDIEAGRPERRQQPRTQARYQTLIKIGANLYGRGYTKDISLSGACLESISIFKLIRPARAYDLKGLAISVRSADPAFSLMGRIVRVDPYKGEAGIAVTELSDEPAWQHLCLSHLQG